MVEMMDEETRRALDGSIDKWKKIVAGTGGDNGARNCPLCLKFRDCLGCPVAARTGVALCADTPFSEWAHHQRAVHQIQWHEPWRVHPDCPECKRLAQAELYFLKSLLPKDANARSHE